MDEKDVACSQIGKRKDIRRRRIHERPKRIVGRQL